MYDIGCEDDDVRLVGGPVASKGTVQICRNDIWGLISENGWDDRDAKVVCRQLFNVNCM